MKDILFVLAVGIITFLALSIASCSNPADKPSTPPAEPGRTYSLGAGYTVYEFKLDDGTRCVVHTTRGGMACQWKEAPR